MTTFEVDAVEVATEPPATQPLGDLVTGTLWMAPAATTPVVPTEGAHPLLAAVHRAFAEHRPLVLSPDAIWLTIAQGVAHHVRLNFEALRGRLVRHAGRKALTVQVQALPTDAEGMRPVLSAFRELLRTEVGAGLPRLLSCDFSTSTDIERMAGDVVLMDTLSPYFDFILACVCGIPRITLLGTPEDWRSIRRRIDVIAELDLGWWTSSLIPIADELVRTSEGRPDREFWQELYKPRKAYGWDRVTGWIARLFPYVGSGGRYTERNPMLARPHAEFLASQPKDANMFQVKGLILSSVPAGLSSVPLEVVDSTQGTRATWAVEAGVLAVTVDEDGALVPRVGVLVRQGSASMAQVVERLFAEHEAKRPTRASTYEGLAELNALFDHAHSATLFPGTRPWRLRALEEQDEVVIPVMKQGKTSVQLLMDLPDGTVLALRPGGGRRRTTLVRLKADQLEPIPPEPGGIDLSPSVGDTVLGGRRLRSREQAWDVSVVGTSLASLLEHVLDTGGAADLPVLGTLYDELEPWERR